MVYQTVKPNILQVNHDYEKHERQPLKTVVKAGRLSGSLMVKGDCYHRREALENISRV
jgi:hypothetical protein